MNMTYGQKRNMILMNGTAGIDQARITKWVVVPGITLASLVLISKIFKGKKRRKK